ncbi:hypothetical protein B7C51_25220 (plasmid) [Paenibacillus larvae subsp. pulvifaciens]|uniref:Phage structural protein n=1 Tax=Paenibacillus larvae subsp. pulvifaciens TaxID=1477 RepID=A0A1V0V005_9BACL|nr:hypothetical protein [Paenibacillus larvae]ARF70774.1 hypothetical protein B7C51_25220 [Paenibacillus larvae subsp. pulvifaciens]
MAKFGVKEVADVTIYDIATNKPVLYLDTLKMTNIENKADSSAARGGKGNSKLLEWDFNKEVTMKMQDALMSFKSLSLMTGNDVKIGVAQVHRREVLVASAGTTGKSKVTLSKVPIEGSISTYLLSDDEIRKEIKSTNTSKEKEVTFDIADVPAGTSVVVFYKFETDANAQTITISADKFPAYVKIIGDTTIRDSKDGDDYPAQFIIHKAKISPNFTLTFQADGEPSVFDMDLTVFKKDDNSDMYEFIQYAD